LPSAVRSVSGRPSLARGLAQRVGQMNSEQKQLYRRRVKEPSGIEVTDGPEILDALLEQRKLNKKSDPQADLKILALRAQLPAAPTQPPPVLGQPPTAGHGSAKFSVSALNQNGATGAGLVFRPALHDLDDPDTGYIPFSSLVVAETGVDYRSDLGRVAFDHFTIAEVANLAPVSWVASGRLYRPADQDCFECLTGQIQAGIGSRLLFFKDNLLLYGLIKGQAETHRYGPSIELASIARISRELKAHLSAEKFVYYDSGKDGEWARLSGTLAVSILPFELRLQVETLIKEDRRETSARLSLGWFK
jgi:hypothetical protein